MIVLIVIAVILIGSMLVRNLPNDKTLDTNFWDK